MSYTTEIYRLKKNRRPVVASGISIGNKISQGKARVITDKKGLSKFRAGEILVTSMTEPDWEPLFKKASAIVTDSGSRTAHIAIVARELGVPAVVGTNIATQAIHTGQKITVDCSQSDVGLVYDGLIPFTKIKTNLRKLPSLKLKLMVNTGAPSQAESLATLPSDGVGLARLEFIINEQIKVHPLALLNAKTLKDKKTKRKIKKIIAQTHHKSGRDFYINTLACGIAQIANAFHPREVIVRLSDFKTNEYQHLLGGDEFEPYEQNPMLGWRGAVRYYDARFIDAFAMECKALKKVREKLGGDNLNILVPFVRTLTEAKKVLKLLDKNGLKQGRNNLKIYMMVEVPSNVILADKFIQLFDGFSLGTNDLTQLILGVDRGSSYLAHLFDERDEAVKKIIKQVISVTHKSKKTIGVCGQAPSDFPEFAKFLAREGIDSISVNPDTVLTTRLNLSKAS